ncbi:MAG: elongation factor G [Deltaproteobacteria bacterium]|nr:elongation factor G [Deltaproteobacteria bacterium]
MVEVLSNIRNLAVVAHHGAGKTLLTEALLFNARALDTFSAMGARPCPLDEDPEEKSRQMTLSPQIYNFSFNDREINFIDTPGYINFMADTRYALKASDSAILIVSALSGVKETSMEYWEALGELELPRFIFVNKLDREKASFVNALSSIEQDLEIRPVCLTIPLGAEEKLHGVIDIVKMKALKYSPEKNGKYQEGPIPDECISEAQACHDKLKEAIIETNEELMNAYLDGQDIPFEKLLPLLRSAVIHKQIIPVFAGSAALNIGLNPLLNAIGEYLPSPDLFKKEWEGTRTDRKTEAKRLVADSSPLSGFVFKTTVDHFSGKVNFVRLVSGTLSLGDSLYISNREKQVKTAHLAKPLGRKLKKISRASAGQIVALEKVDFLETCDTVSSLTEPIVYPPVARPDRLIFCSLKAKDRSSEEKVMEALHKVMEEDPNIEYHRDTETHELLLCGMGQFHLEIVKERLKRKYEVDIELAVPHVPYKETIKASSKAQGKYKKQSGGHGQYGDCWIELSPLPRGGGFEFANNIVGGMIPKNFIPSVEKGIVEAMQDGIVAGYPVVDVKASLYDGSYHTVDSSDIAFKIAGAMAFRKCMEQARPILLEPIMDVKITVPTDSLGAIIQDLNSRRGKVAGVEPKANAQIVRARVPLSEMLVYDNMLKGITQGKGIFTMHHDTFEEAPSPIAQKVIQERKKEKES